MRGEVRAGRREGVGWRPAAQAACTEKARLKAVGGGQGTRGAHLEHRPHDCDLGRVEAQRLVERVRRELLSRREGHAMRGEVRAGRWESVGWRKQHARGRPATTQGFWGSGHARSART